MAYNPTRHHRRSIRLQGYDYTQPGAYFVTIVTHHRTHLFGAVVDGNMQLNDWGDIVRDEWFKTAQIRPYVQLRDDEFVVMPNHIHGIIWIVGDGSRQVGARSVEVGMRRRGARPSGGARPSVGARPSGGARRQVGARRRRAPTGARSVEVGMRRRGARPSGGTRPSVGARPSGGARSRRIPTDDHTFDIHTLEQFGKPVCGSIPTIIRSFKSAVTKRINRLRNSSGKPVWQRNYYEHIIRRERTLNAIRQYIIDNPHRWHMDRENDCRTGNDPLARDIWEMFQKDDRQHIAGRDR